MCRVDGGSVASTGYKLLKEDLKEFPTGSFTLAANVAIAGVLLIGFYIDFQQILSSTGATRKSTGETDDGIDWDVFLGACFIMTTQVGLIYDNGINFLGRYAADLNWVRDLSKYRFVLHVASMPLLGISVTEIARQNGLLLHQAWFIRTALAAISATDGLRWLLFHDSKDLILVDMRDSKTNLKSRLAGTLTFTITIDKAWEMILPPVLLVLYEFSIGLVMFLQRSLEDQVASDTSIALLLSATLTLLSSSATSVFPDLQLYGENLHSALLWIALTRPYIESRNI